ncbi:neutral zinc metallopeptidase [Kribbella sp. CA-245084]|uniref:neutral zinc metallopeptidase n=1 Tax=Kribbella sp. CA-245084 TaxID=3239940 RepID=UPI003D8B3E0C
MPKATSTYRSLDEIYLVYNKVYSAGRVPAVPCKLPQIPLQTQKQVQQYANAILGCLDRAWKPVVGRSDVVYSATAVYAVDQGWKTGCGIFGKDDEGFYCAGAGIYLDWDEFTEESPDDRAWAGVYLQFTMAHEFGHHVQQLTGISSYFDDRWSEASGAARLEQMRRHELQASCFASAFLGANQQTLDLYGERLQAYRDSAYSGDDDAPATTPDHGSRRSSTAWAKAAFKAKSPSACNTWAAPAKRVT